MRSEQKISATQGGFSGPLDPHDVFGRFLAPVGDLDGDGVTDLAAGAIGDDDGGTDRGAIWILLMERDGTVKSSRKISATRGNFAGPLDDGSFFGLSVASLGDFDFDGVPELAVGMRGNVERETEGGAVWVLFLDRAGTVKSQRKIAEGEGGFGGKLDHDDVFSTSLAPLNDIDGDGVPDLAVGARYDDDGGMNRGAVWILFLNRDGSVKAHQKISAKEGGFGATDLDDEDHLGQSLAALGDVDGDGVTDLAVGAFRDDDGGENRGAVWLLFLRRNGTVKSKQKISDTEGGFSGTLDDGDLFASGLASPGDLDGDGVTDLVVGARKDDDGGSLLHGAKDRGAVWILFLNRDGTVKSHRKISEVAGNFGGSLNDDAQFGYSLASLGDLDGDGVTDLATSAIFDDDGGENSGAIWVLFLDGDSFR